MKKDLGHLFDVMSRFHGRDISFYDESFLAKSVEKRMAAVSIELVDTYLAYLSARADEADQLFASLNITFSEFFRNPLTFALLENLILPELIERKERTEIRIWSTACSAGQEPYSIAMLLDDLIARRGKTVRFRIFATDRSGTELASAKRGVYEFGAVQNVRLKHIRSYFTQQGETFKVTAGIRDRIDFSFHDLLDQCSACPPESIYGDFDLVICNNVLFYYRPDIQRCILAKVYSSLSDKGYLITGEAEKAIVERTEGFCAVASASTIFQRTIGRKR